MRAHFGQFLSREREQFAGAATGIVPAFKHAVNHRPLPRRSRLGIQLVECLQPQDRRSIKLVRIAAQPVERGDRQSHIALRQTGARRWLLISRSGRALIDPPRQLNRPKLAVVRGQIAQHSLYPQHKPAGDHRPGLIAQGPA